MPSTKQHTSRYYKPRRDWWVVTIGLVFALIFVLMVPVAFWTDLPLWQQLLMAGVGLVVALSTIDKLFFLVYELGPEGLQIHSQLRKLTVPYRSMRSIVPGGLKGLFTTRKRKRFALSRHSLVIQVQNPVWNEVTVSPQHKDAFLKQLLATIDAERSRRATVNRLPVKKSNS